MAANAEAHSQDWLCHKTWAVPPDLMQAVTSARRVGGIAVYRGGGRTYTFSEAILVRILDR